MLIKEKSQVLQKQYNVVTPNRKFTMDEETIYVFDGGDAGNPRLQRPH